MLISFDTLILKALADCRRISDMALNAKILTHTRCHMDDVEKAVDSGVDGVNIYMVGKLVVNDIINILLLLSGN